MGYLKDHKGIKHTLITAVAIIHVSFLFFTLFATLDMSTNKRVVQMIITMVLNGFISGFIIKILNPVLALVAGLTWLIPIILVITFRYNDILLQLDSI